MAITTVRVSNRYGEWSCDLIYVDRYGHGVGGPTTGLAFLHRVRQLPDGAWDRREAEQFYLEVVPEVQARLTSRLGDRAFDVVLRPPSKRDDALPYLEAIQLAIPSAEDWSSFFSHSAGASAGVNRSIETLARALSFEPPTT